MSEPFISDTPDAPPLLQVRDLAVQYPSPQGRITVIEEVSFELERNSVLCLVGESGSGKSVTARAIAGLIYDEGGSIPTGSIRFDGRELIGLKPRQLNRMRGRDIGFIFQEPMTSLNPAFTVGEQISEVVRRHQNASRRAAWKRAVEMLDNVGIASAASRAKEYPHSFSGGMRQRVMIALALACDPKLLIADEPTTALDVTIQAWTLELLKDLKDEFEMSVLFITHDLGVVADIADNVVVMYAGQVVESSEVEALFASPRHPYTGGLLKAMPQEALARGTALSSIPGMVPRPTAMPVGCRFNPRCPFVKEGLCTHDPIPLTATEIGSVRCAREDELAGGIQSGWDERVGTS